MTVEQAEEAAQETDPAVLEASTSTTLEGETIKPQLTNEEQLFSEHALTSSSVAKENTGEFAVNTPDGDLSLKPLESSHEATTLPTLVNGTVALFANTSPATDTIIRPDALGATAVLNLRSAEAPKSFSWEVSLGAGQQLQQLSNGSVVVTDSPETVAEPEASKEPEPHETGMPAPESPTEEAEREQREKEPETVAPLEPPPPAPTSSTSPAETPAGELEPQNTLTQYESATSAMDAAETETTGTTLMAIESPQVVDAHGHTVPAFLSVHEDTITLTIKPGEISTYPLLAAVSVAAPSDKVSAERDPFEYGLADNLTATFDNEEALRLTGPTAPLHIQSARRVVPWDIKSRPAERVEVEQWVTAVEKRGLEPYLTIEADTKKVEATEKLENLSVPEYRAKVKGVISTFERKGVNLWGAWNEPELYPYQVSSVRAAKYWQASESIIVELGCHCTVVAGEFSRYNKGDASFGEQYQAGLLRYEPAAWSSSHKAWKSRERIWKRHRIPRVWGFHDYQDVANFRSTNASEFQGFASGKFGTPQIWISEAGIEPTTTKNRLGP